MKLKERKVTIPELMLIGGTRVALGLVALHALEAVLLFASPV